MERCIKKKYTKREGQEHLNYLQHMKRKRDTVPCRLYPCPECTGYWHLTSDKKDKGSTIRPIKNTKAFRKYIQKEQ